MYLFKAFFKLGSLHETLKTSEITPICELKNKLHHLIICHILEIIHHENVRLMMQDQ